MKRSEGSLKGLKFLGEVVEKKEEEVFEGLSKKTFVLHK